MVGIITSHVVYRKMVDSYYYLAISNGNFTGDLLMDDLQLFRQWCEKLGHYAATEAVDRYIAMIKSKEDNG